MECKYSHYSYRVFSDGNPMKSPVAMVVIKLWANCLYTSQTPVPSTGKSSQGHTQDGQSRHSSEGAPRDPRDPIALQIPASFVQAITQFGRHDNDAYSVCIAGNRPKTPIAIVVIWLPPRSLCINQLVFLLAHRLKWLIQITKKWQSRKDTHSEG